MTDERTRAERAVLGYEDEPLHDYPMSTWFRTRLAERGETRALPDGIPEVAAPAFEPLPIVTPNADWTREGPAALAWIAWLGWVSAHYPEPEWHNHLPGADAILAVPLPPSAFLPTADRIATSARHVALPAPSVQPVIERPAEKLEGRWRYL